VRVAPLAWDEIRRARRCPVSPHAWAVGSTFAHGPASIHRIKISAVPPGMSWFALDGSGTPPDTLLCRSCSSTTACGRGAGRPRQWVSSIAVRPGMQALSGMQSRRLFDSRRSGLSTSSLKTPSHRSARRSTRLASGAVLRMHALLCSMCGSSFRMPCRTPTSLAQASLIDEPRPQRRHRDYGGVRCAVTPR